MLCYEGHTVRATAASLTLALTPGATTMKRLDRISNTALYTMVPASTGSWLYLTERHEHQHEHEALEHGHAHVHDIDHQHEQEPGDASVRDPKPHTHPHRHTPVVHTHPHYPDIHHRHGHE